MAKSSSPSLPRFPSPRTSTPRRLSAIPSSPSRRDTAGADRLLNHTDGWQNLLTGLGDARRDKRLSSAFLSDRMTWEEAEELYRGDDMAARIVDTLPEEMTREGFELQVGEDKGLADDVMGAFEELELLEETQECLAWSRAYGGAGMLLGVDDGQRDLTRPLNEDNIRSFTWVTNLSPRELRPLSWYGDPTGPRFGQPATYAVMPLFAPGPSTAKSNRLPYLEVHESRILRFDGVRVSRRQLYENMGWGDSVLSRCQHVIRDFQASWASAAVLIQDFAQGVIKLKGLAKLLGTNGEKAIADRLRILDMMRSVLRAIPLDSEDSFERTVTPMAGLSNTLELMCLRLCAAARMPVILLMGQAPGGLQATGDIDLQWFYDTVRAAQRKVLKRRIRRLVFLMMKSKRGPTRGRIPRKWDFEFRSLWQLTPTQSADIRLKTAQADKSDLDAGVLLPEEVATSRYGGVRYSTETVLDLDLRAAREEGLQTPVLTPPDPAPPPLPPPPPPEPDQPSPGPDPSGDPPTSSAKATKATSASRNQR